jgi:viroplasmin and RNaseH domain-containing protein
MRHFSWSECEQRVKGQSGAKFKKAMSADEEKQVLQFIAKRPIRLTKKHHYHLLL